MNTTNKNKLILIRGLPGASKSTLAKTKYVPIGFIHLEADMYFERSGSYVFDPKLLGKAHEWCQFETKKNLMDGKNVVVSNTATTVKEVNDYAKIAKEMSVPFTVYKATGNFKNVHNVPEEVLQKMADRWQDYPGEIVLPIPT